MSSKIGFIGLGIMGKPMVKNLLKAGHEVTVYDIMPAGMDEVAAAGAQKGTSPKDVAGRNDIIITMVPDGPEVEQAVLGPNGVLEGAKKGSTVIDMSSISPMVSQKVGAALEAKGIDFLDAPVSGGEPKAIDGTLAIMVGGKQEVFDKSGADPQDDGIDRHADGQDRSRQRHEARESDHGGVQHRGDGRGARSGHEGWTGSRSGVQCRQGRTGRQHRAERQGADGVLAQFQARIPDPPASEGSAQRLLAAESLKVSLPLTSAVQNMLIDLMNNGKGDLDHSAIVQVIEEASAVEVKKPS